MDGGLSVQDGLTIPEDELRAEAVRAGGPGGQNVNKVATKVVLRWSVTGSRALSEAQRARLLERLAHRLTRAGEIVLHASSTRQQSRNLEEARARLAALVAGALKVERTRKPTRPTRGSKRRRLDSKRRRGALKRERGQGPGQD